MKALLVYKSSALNSPASDPRGLGISATAASLVLRAQGYNTIPTPAFDGYELEDKLKQDKTITHVVFYAPWIDMDFLGALARRWPAIQFTVAIHSNLAFLQSDPFAVKIIRQGIVLAKSQSNFTISSNSERLASYLTQVYDFRVPLLPNLYPLSKHEPTLVPKGDTLVIGIFGAVRQLKNVLSSVGAVVRLAKDTPVELFMSTARVEGGEGILRAVNELISGHPVRLIETSWYGWERFRRLVSSMDLLLQPSFSESFNNVTADGASQYIPSVISPAIAWAPSYWQAQPDDVLDIHAKAVALLANPQSGVDGHAALASHNENSVKAWAVWLK